MIENISENMKTSFGVLLFYQVPEGGWSVSNLFYILRVTHFLFFTSPINSHINTLINVNTLISKPQLPPSNVIFAAIFAAAIFATTILPPRRRRLTTPHLATVQP